MSSRRSVAGVVALSALVLAVVGLVASMVVARLGGGGPVTLVLIVGVPLVLIYPAILAALLYRKSRKSQALIFELHAGSPSWDEESIRGRISEVYFGIQQALAERSPETAHDLMSPTLLERERKFADDLIAERRKLVIENIDLQEATIIGVADRAEAAGDFWVYMQGSMTCYLIDEASGDIVSGDPAGVEEFSEIWKFTTGTSGWVADEIQTKAGVTEIARVEAVRRSVSHEGARCD